MPTARSIRPRPSQLVWLAAIIAAGLIVGFAAGPWWGLGAAAVVLAISEIIERVGRSASSREPQPPQRVE